MNHRSGLKGIPRDSGSSRNALGHPKTPYDLRHADFVSIDHSGGMIKPLNSLGLGLTEANFPLLTESYLVMWELVKQGAAIGILDAHT